MKALSMVTVLSVMASLVGCGSASSTCPVGQVENEAGECVLIPECWGDNDCPLQHACINFTCISKPECRNDLDCANVEAICNAEYKCVSFLTTEACYKQPCTEDCSSCGDKYLTCYVFIGSACESSCIVYSIKRIESALNFCNEQDLTCKRCDCYRSGKEYAAENDSCSEAETVCNPDRTAKRTIDISDRKYELVKGEIENDSSCN